MARPAKKGLEYFNVDTEWENEMKLMKARFGLLGVGCMIELWKTIYKHGYLIKWDEDTQLLFCSENQIQPEKLDEIVSYACKKSMFDSGLLEKGFLTSHGIQKRWVEISKLSGRKANKIDDDFCLILVSSEKTAVNSEETAVNSEETAVNSDFMPQSKVKESKVKESKVKESISLSLSLSQDENSETETQPKIWHEQTPDFKQPEQNQESIFPTLDEVIKYASIVGIQKQDAEKFYNHFESVNWIDAQGRQIKKWKLKLQNWKIDSVTLNGKENKTVSEVKQQNEIKKTKQSENSVLEKIKQIQEAISDCQEFLDLNEARQRTRFETMSKIVKCPWKTLDEYIQFNRQQIEIFQNQLKSFEVPIESRN